MDDEFSAPDEEQASYPEEGYDGEVCYPGDGYDVPEQNGAGTPDRPPTVEDLQALQKELQEQAATSEVISTTLEEMNRLHRDMLQNMRE